jgi:hypothetical protein
MSLKTKKSQTPSEPINRKDELHGPWGRINPEAQSVVTLRLCKKLSPTSEETYSYPYRVLSSWHWRSGVGEEELKIEAGGDLISVKGRGLDRIVDALDRGTLEILCEVPDEGTSMEGSRILLSSIRITSV